MVVPMVVLALLCIGFGVFVSWPVAEWIAPAVSQLDPQLLPPGQEVAYTLGLWHSSQATVLLLVGLLLGVVLYLVGRVGQVCWTRGTSCAHTSS